MKETSMMQKKRVLSLFSGCGGMDLGFEGDFYIPKVCLNENLHASWIKKENGQKVLLNETNFETVFANDILSSAKVAWQSFFKKRGKNPNVFFNDSIVDLVKKYQQNQFNFPNNIDVVTGGFPCQDFSVAGKRNGFFSDKSHNGEICEKNDHLTENRGMLYKWMREVIEITKPKVFIAENVKGLVSLGNVKAIIEQDFRNIDCGYLVVPAKTLCVADYGIAQKRERVIFIGLNKRFLKKKFSDKGNCNHFRDFIYPLKTHFSNQSKNQQLDMFSQRNSELLPYVKTKDILSDLPEPNLCFDDYSQMFYSKAKYGGKTQGQIEIDLNGLAPTIRSEHHGNIEYRRLSIDHGGKHFDEINQGLIERRLTIRECARIQTFPDDYDFVIPNQTEKKNYILSPSNAYKIIGNAVPPFLAYHVAKRLETIWDELFEDIDNK
jgi:DNA (cytosine-5)-methyltransferase 1